MTFIVDTCLHFAAYVVVVALGQGNTASVNSHFKNDKIKIKNLKSK